MTGHSFAATQQECPVCGGPCREPFPLPPVQENYPFMTAEEIAHVNAAAEPANDVEPDPTPRAGRRMRRPAETRPVVSEHHDPVTETHPVVTEHHDPVVEDR